MRYALSFHKVMLCGLKNKQILYKISNKTMMICSSLMQSRLLKPHRRAIRMELTKRNLHIHGSPLT